MSMVLSDFVFSGWITMWYYSSIAEIEPTDGENWDVSEFLRSWGHEKSGAESLWKINCWLHQNRTLSQGWLKSHIRNQSIIHTGSSIKWVIGSRKSVKTMKSKNVDWVGVMRVRDSIKPSVWSPAWQHSKNSGARLGRTRMLKPVCMVQNCQFW